MSAIANYLGSLFSTPTYKDSRANKIANDKPLTTYRSIRKILNVSNKILGYISLGSLAGSLVLGGARYFNISIFNLSSQSFQNIGWNCFLANLGIFASNAIIGVLERRQLVHILKEMFPECDLDNSTITLKDKKIKIVNNITNAKTVINFD